MMVKTDPNEQKKVISDLRPFSHYSLEVAVYNRKGEGPRSEALSFETPEGGEIKGKEGVEEELVTRLEEGEVMIK